MSPNINLSAVPEHLRKGEFCIAVGNFDVLDTLVRAESQRKICTEVGSKKYHQNILPAGVHRTFAGQISKIVMGLNLAKVEFSAK
jgi:hypothetical protein